MTAHESEAEDNSRLRKADEFVAHSITQENAARRALARATEQTQRARAKRSALFQECEARAYARRKAGLIQNVAVY